MNGVSVDLNCELTTTPVHGTDQLLARDPDYQTFEPVRSAACRTLLPASSGNSAVESRGGSTIWVPQATTDGTDGPTTTLDRRDRRADHYTGQTGQTGRTCKEKQRFRNEPRMRPGMHLTCALDKRLILLIKTCSFTEMTPRSQCTCTYVIYVAKSQGPILPSFQYKVPNVVNWQARRQVPYMVCRANASIHRRLRPARCNRTVKAKLPGGLLRPPR